MIKHTIGYDNSRPVYRRECHVCRVPGNKLTTLCDPVWQVRRSRCGEAISCKLLWPCTPFTVLYTITTPGCLFWRVWSDGVLYPFPSRQHLFWSRNRVRMHDARCGRAWVSRMNNSACRLYTVRTRRHQTSIAGDNGWRNARTHSRLGNGQNAMNGAQNPDYVE